MRISGWIEQSLHPAKDQPWRSWNSSCQAIWMASSLASLEAAGSPEKPVSSVIHLCMSVKRTVRGSVSGYLSARPMAMSSKLSQPKVGGMSAPGKDLTPRKRSSQRKTAGLTRRYTESVIELLGVVLIPVGDFNDDVGGAVGNKGDSVFLRCGFIFYFFDVWVAAAHFVSP